MKRFFILFSLTLIFKSNNAQRSNWQNLDLKSDSVFGISTEKVYEELLSKRKARPIIVAVIDSGIDTTHEDLHETLWRNEKEVPGNGIDDDHNGYIDDIYGWNFVYSETGREDITNLAGQNKDFYDSLGFTRIPEVFRESYQVYKKISSEFNQHIESLQQHISNLENIKLILDRVEKKIGKDNPTKEELLKFTSDDESEKRIVREILDNIPYCKDYRSYRICTIDSALSEAEFHLDHGLNPNFKDVDSEMNKAQSGNGDVSKNIMDITARVNPTIYHGTHVAGIIAACRDNGKGINGVADHVKIMTLRVLDNVRELRDINLANAIRYAVDNGAKIINMSFGKYYTWNKKCVDDAIRYAMKKDVLLILAAGNSGIDIDQHTLYPSRVYQNGEISKAWLTVGASGPKDDSLLVPSFSNYGQTMVDVFAPGVQIRSAIPGSKYEDWSGTSMAAPVVAGLAALLWEYYPKLSAIEVKDIIMKSVIKIRHNVFIKDGNGQTISVPFSKLCISGGIINAYNAFALAAKHYSN